MKTKQTLLIVLALLLLISIACSFPGAPGSMSGQPQGLVENYVPDLGGKPLGFYSYSPDQLSVQSIYGNPTRFTIMFGEKTRQETWIYDNDSYQVVFRDGVKVAEQSSVSASLEGLSVVMYEPSFFYRGMGVDEVVSATGQNDFVLTSVDGVVSGGQLMHLKGLSAGFSDDEVLFVETLPVVSE